MKATRQQVVALFYLALSLLWIVPFITLIIRNGVLMTPDAEQLHPVLWTFGVWLRVSLVTTIGILYWVPIVCYADQYKAASPKPNYLQGLGAYLLKERFPMKFKVRVRHIKDGKYTIDWAYYRFICVWGQLSGWSDANKRWYPYVSNYELAEDTAKNITSFGKLHSYYQTMWLKEEEWKKQQAEATLIKSTVNSKNIPYQIKEIINTVG